ncbi:YjcZ family sporulation protein [Bacillus atrophaeus]
MYYPLKKEVANMGYSNGYGSSFALIVVLFILLIIVGAAFFG